MAVIPYSEDMRAYLSATDVIDFEDASIAELSDALMGASVDKLDYIRRAYECVRDRFAHSADAGRDQVTLRASEVLKAGHGICFAKSHLLAALLRRQGIPAGFCYQRLILDDEAAPYLILHGLNGVFLAEYDRWIRLDARGNKKGVDAQFSVEEERLAFPVRSELGEEDIMTVYPEPDANVVKKFREHATRTGLWNDLPRELAYPHSLS